MSNSRFLGRAYDLQDKQAVEAFYDGWAATYDAEIAENGYATPRRAAEALAACIEDRARPVLDIGCGTGLSGIALASVGFTTIDGTDLSDEMLARAQQRGVYRKMFAGDLDDPLPAEAGAYSAAAAVGVISPGHASPETVDAVLAALSPGGYFVFSLNDHALAVSAYPGKIEEVTTNGAAELIFREHGPHLPGIGLEATVYVLKKA